MMWIATAAGLLRRAALPAFLLLLLVLGGASREGFMANAVLQIASAFILAWCCLDPRLNRLTPAAWRLLAIAAVWIAITLAQLVPLPPDWWSQLPGRQIVADGLVAMGEELPWLPLSMAPEETLFGVLKILPALAAFTLAAKLTPRALTDPLGWTVTLLAAASVGLGLAQIFGGRDSPLYFHAFTNWGSPVGFMANVNHQASLLLMAIPFGAVLIARLLVNAQLGDRNAGLGIIVATLLLVILLGVMIAGSTAGYGLLLPAILLSLLIARRGASGATTVGALFAVSIAVGVLAAVVASSPRLVGLGFTDLSGSALGRPDTYVRTLDAIADTLPLGSGLGSFEQFFPGYEDPSQVTSTFMNHAHNDYLEFVLEYGLAGGVIIVLFLAWFIWRSIAIWRADGEDGGSLRKAATVAVLIVILHSIVDYPLRTAAVSGLAGVCLGVMAARAEAPRRRRRDQAPGEAAQHVTI